MTPQEITFEQEVLEHISGKIFLLQDPGQRRQMIYEVFRQVCRQKQFQKLLGEIVGFDPEQAFERFMSYRIIEEFLADDDVEDIMIDFLSPIYVHKTNVGIVRTDRCFGSREEIELFIKKLVIFSGRSTIHKINNVELVGVKGRANIVYSPFGPQITITRIKERPLSIVDLVKNGTLTAELAAQFWLYVEGMGVRPTNMIIAGGPGAGKTTLLNALLSFIPEDERMVVIEDTLELNTDFKQHCARLESDEEVNLADLVKNALRMRPDRVIVGEVRGREAGDLMTAMNIGKYCMGTLHASTAREAILRLENEPMNVPHVLINLVDVFVIMRRRHTNGAIRRVVGEVVETAGLEREQVLLSLLWACDLSTLQCKERSAGSVYRDRLAQISGRPPTEIIAELKVRSSLIDFLVKKQVADIVAVTAFCNRYIKTPQTVLDECGIDRAKLK